MIDRITLMCLAASACLAVILPLELRSDVTKPVIPAPATIKSKETFPTRNDASAINKEVATAVGRPLFSPSRRPPEVEAGGHPDTSLNDWRLTGILIMPDHHLAIFTGSDGKPVVRSEGEMISDWRVDGISSQSISLTGPTGTTTLEPKADPHLNRLQLVSQPAQPAAAAPSPPPAPTSGAPVRPKPTFNRTTKRE